jgi:hypothetical protein
MSGMVEKVARAIYAADEMEFDAQIPWGDADAEVHSYWFDMARASIEAMREPTDAMVDAVWTQPDSNGSQYPIGGYREQYRAMIDAALNEQVAE